MSKRIYIPDLNQQTKAKVVSDLTFKGLVDSTFAFDIIGDELCVPFAYGNKHNVLKPKSFEKIDIKFLGQLKPEQKQIKKEVISDLNSQGSTILSAACGFGKCLGKDTPVMMSDGLVKMVQDIRVGDTLMGDDSTPRTVLSLARGREMMYEIKPTKGESYVVNESHVLSLKNGNQVVDICLRDYINQETEMKGYHVPVDFPEKKLENNPYEYTNKLGYVPHLYKCNSREIRLNILTGIIDNFGTLIHDFYDIIHTSEKMIDDVIYIARSLGFSAYKKNKFNAIVYLELENVGITVIKKNVDDYYGFEIDGNRRFLLGDFTVTHNTITAINITSKIKLKTLVVVNRIILLDQWKQSVEQFSDARCLILKPNVFKKKDLLDYDVYIINITNISKIPDSLSFGFVIADELHLLISEGGINHLLCLAPKYLLGLSATPYRMDHLNKCIDEFFGTNRITKKLEKQHQVFKVDTKFVPDYQLNVMGKIDWNSVLNSQAESPERNDLIIKLVDTILKENPKRNILILVKRIAHGSLLKLMLEEKGLQVDTLLGKSKYKETDNNILIGTTSKVGTGFDAPKLDTLVLASDVQAYFIQQLGRIFRRSNNDPRVYDLVDNFGVLKSHYYSRRKVYLEAGGKIENFKVY
jgi:superfamily II DNA or RNA helicase